jgi:hypothetical protein
MIEANQNSNNISAKKIVNEEFPKSQKKLVIALLILVIILLSALTYFLIKDKILQFPFINLDHDKEEIIDEETNEEESVIDVELEDESEDDTDEEQSDNTVELDETENIDTVDWLTFQLNNPQLSFKYPDGITVREYPEEDSNYVHLAISGARESLNLYIFQAVGGPGAGTATEIEEPESIKVIGEFFNQDIIEIKNGDFYKFASYLTECEDCGDTSIYLPECICEDTDNYVMNGIFTTDLDWEEDNGGDTYIAIELKWTLTEDYREIYNNILLSFQKE